MKALVHSHTKKELTVHIVDLGFREVAEETEEA